MTDYLLVHGAGQGAWSWGPVWGHLTAPEEHPPTLHKRRKANRVHPLDLPGHGADAGGDTSAVRLEECVQAITRAVQREGLKDMVSPAAWWHRRPARWKSRPSEWCWWLG